MEAVVLRVVPHVLVEVEGEDNNDLPESDQPENVRKEEQSGTSIMDKLC